MSKKWTCELVYKSLILIIENTKSNFGRNEEKSLCNVKVKEDR